MVFLSRVTQLVWLTPGLITAALGAAAASVFPAGLIETCQPSPDPTYSCHVPWPKDGLEGEYEVFYNVTEDGWLSVKVCSMNVAKRGAGWLSWGISPDGRMIGSDAIIGMHGEVWKYKMGGYSVSSVVRLPDNQQDLRDASFATEGSKTTLTFKRLLQPSVPEGGVAEEAVKPGENMFLWAYGVSKKLGYHAIAGHLYMDMSDRLLLGSGVDIGEGSGGSSSSESPPISEL